MTGRWFAFLAAAFSYVALASAQDNDHVVTKWMRQNGAANELLVLHGSSGDLYERLLQMPIGTGDMGVERVIGRYLIRDGRIRFVPFRTTCPRHEPAIQEFNYDVSMEQGRLSLGHKAGYTKYLWMPNVPELKDPQVDAKLAALQRVTPVVFRFEKHVRPDNSVVFGCVGSGQFSPHEEVETVVSREVKAARAEQGRQQ